MNDDFDIIKETKNALGFEVKPRTETRLDNLEKTTKHLTKAVTTLSEMQKLLHEQVKTLANGLTILKEEIEK